MFRGVHCYLLVATTLFSNVALSAPVHKAETASEWWEIIWRMLFRCKSCNLASDSIFDEHELGLTWSWRSLRPWQHLQEEPQQKMPCCLVELLKWQATRQRRVDIIKGIGSGYMQGLTPDLTSLFVIKSKRKWARHKGRALHTLAMARQTVSFTVF